MRSLFIALTFALSFLCSIPAAAANSWGTDMSDLWINPNESGWGVNLTHQQEIIFMTMFVYGPDNSVKWYVASAMTSLGGSNQYTFTGTLYQTSGPYLGGPFNPNNVFYRQVGTATLTFPSISSATLSYSVDGVGVAKTIQRFAFRQNQISGSYIGAAIGSATGCGSASGTFANTAQFVVSQSGTSVAIAASISNGLSCTYSGSYFQDGRMGDIEGTLACSNGGHGSFSAFEIEASYQGFFARYTADYGGGCTESGRIGGMKR